MPFVSAPMSNVSAVVVPPSTKVPVPAANTADVEYSASKSVTADQPSAGSVNATRTLWLAWRTAVAITGAEGVVYGVTNDDSVEVADQPAALAASSENVYPTPGVSPPKTSEVKVEETGLTVRPVTPTAADPAELYTVTR